MSGHRYQQIKLKMTKVSKIMKFYQFNMDGA